MKSLLWCVLIAVSVKVAISKDLDLHALSDEFIDSINREQSLWEAGRNFDKDLPLSFLKNLLGYRRSINRPAFSKIFHDSSNVEVPDHFDWRDVYPNCTTLKEIRDQSQCGSCWAFATVEAISDRICINTKGRLDVSISADDLMCCCAECGNGCEGGDPLAAYEYWKSVGIVTGGGYNSSQGCRPYEIPPTINSTATTPSCKKTCRDGYPTTYKGDLHFGKSAYAVDNDVKQIQIDIMKNGPVTASFDVYGDFFAYKTGVYRHTKGALQGRHSVKILGWGVEDSTGRPYWLVANSWSTTWGRMGGFFKILRGENLCGIEAEVTAGIPLDN